MKKMKKVILELTELEARVLYLVVNNGWGDGDFSDYLGGASETAAALRAMNKLREARELPAGLRGEAGR